MKKILFLFFYFHFVNLKLFLNFQMIKKNDFMNKIIVNNVYVNEKKIDFEIKFNDYKIYISNYLIKEKNNNENETYFKELNDFDGFKTKNDFNINDKLINDINVIAIEDDENNYYNNNIIGFEYRRNQENFLKQLYNKNIIENEIIFIDFYQNKIFFDYPKNISNIKYIKANIDGFLINFSINLDKIYTNLIKKNNNNNNYYSDFIENKFFEIEFNFNLNGIVAPFEFKNYLINNLNLLNYCEKISYIENNLYYYFKCKNSKILINNLKNININFYNKFINFTFNLNLKDFCEKENNNNFILKILFNEYYNNWILGKIFLEKYPFVFDYSKKLLGIIIKTENNNHFYIKIFYFFSYFILIIIILFLIRYLKLLKTRKKRTNEIFDGFYYNFSTNKNNINNNNKKIIN